MKNGFDKSVLGSVLSFRWSVSRCSLWVDGCKVSSCNGGGYDMKGTAAGNWIEKRLDIFPGVLRLASDTNLRYKNVRHDGFYGLCFYDKAKKTWRKHYKPGYLVKVDGRCGFRSVENILNALGLKLRFISERRNETTYTIEAL